MRVMNFLLSLLVAVLFSGCAASIETVQRIDPGLTFKSVDGKTMGLIVRRKASNKSTLSSYERYDPDTRQVRLLFNEKSLNDKAVDIQSGETGILSGEFDLFSYFPILSDKEKNLNVPIDSKSIKEILARDKLDCLLLVNLGFEDTGTASANYFKIAEFATRMASGILTHTSSPGSGGGFGGSNVSYARTIMMYTCGESTPLYVGGAQGKVGSFTIEQVAYATLDDFNAALAGKKVSSEK